MAQSLVVENGINNSERDIMHSLRSFRMRDKSSGGIENKKNLRSESKEGRLNELRHNTMLAQNLDASMMSKAELREREEAVAEEDGGSDKGANLRGKEPMSRAKALRGMQAMKGGSGANQSMALPLDMPSANLLRWAWIALIPSFGLTLIWINIHAFMRWIFPTFFCKLGSEWIPRPVRRMNQAAGTFAFYVEAMVLLFLDIFVLVSFTLIVSVIAIASMGLWELVKEGGKYVWRLVSGV